MLLTKHDDSTSLEDCLLILSENALRYLWLLSQDQTESEEFVWLANAIDYRNSGIADMHMLCLIEVGYGVNDDQTKPDGYTIEERGRELIEYALTQGVSFESLAVNIAKFQ